MVDRSVLRHYFKMSPGALWNDVGRFAVVPSSLLEVNSIPALHLTIGLTILADSAISPA